MVKRPLTRKQRLAKWMETERKNKVRRMNLLRKVLPDLKDEQVVRFESAYLTGTILGRILRSKEENRADDEEKRRQTQIFFKSQTVLRRFQAAAEKLRVIAKPYHPIVKRGLDWVKTQHPRSLIVDEGQLADIGKPVNAPGDFGDHRKLTYYAIVYHQGGTNLYPEYGTITSRDILHANLVIIRDRGKLYRYKDRFCSFPAYNEMTEEEADRRVEAHLHAIRCKNDDGTFPRYIVNEVWLSIPGISIVQTPGKKGKV
jgi:hypothetical protein